MYLAKTCCDSKDEILVNGHSWLRSCHLAVGVVGVIGTFSLPLTCIIPRADSCTIVCAVHQRHLYKSSAFLAVMAGDCGDKIPSKSKPQSAGVTSCASFENVLRLRCFFSNCHTRTSFKFLAKAQLFVRFSVNFKKILHIRLCHPTSFNAPLCYYLSSPVLKIFVAASFSF